MRITVLSNRAVMNGKKVYISSLIIRENCPSCGEMECRPEDSSILPEPGKTSKVHFYCPSCDRKWSQFVLVEINAREVV